MPGVMTPSERETGPKARIRKPGCTPCRERHLRCDHVQPKCSNCRRARQPLQCTYAPVSLKVRPSIYSSQAAQDASIPPRETSPERAGAAIVPLPASPPESLSLGAHSTVAAPVKTTVGGPIYEESHPPQGGYTDPSERLASSPDSTLARPRVWRVVTDSLDAKLFAFYVKHAGPWVRALDAFFVSIVST
ncbi:hypothetical protein VTK73DRAFT_1206 [Phialemonium thermophilum]|uniref:Zn(2)-C6 fungal-type domain-containing protein n=1 Tax=Phialemonium thermophilum TaxID=223376 RepID=A0ABR3VTX1_9PEZI